MLSAFLTGFVGGVAKQIEEDDKIARDEMNARVQQRMKEKAIAQAKADELREELKGQAKALRAIYSDATEADLIGVINSGMADAYIKNGIDAQSRARTTASLKQTQAATGEAPLTMTATAKRGQPLFIPAAGEELPYKTVEELITARTTLVKPTGATMGEPSDTTSFGLRLTGPEREKRAALARAGMTEEELLATKLPEIKDIPGRINLDILKEEEGPETTAAIKAKLRDRIAGKGTIEEAMKDPETANLFERLQAAVVVEGMFDEEGGEKPRTAAQISSVFDKTIQAGIEPFILKGVVRFDEASKSYVPVRGAKGGEQFINYRNSIIREQSIQMGILDAQGNIYGGRNTRDALAPFATIKGDKIVSWGGPAAPKAPATPKAPAAVPEPKTQAEYDAIPKGTRYRDTDGELKIKR